MKKTVIWAFSAVVVVFVCFLAVGFMLGFKTYLVAGTDSMEPMLRRNDLIVIKKHNFNDIKTGDIIAFQHQNHVITHKVVNVIIDEQTNTRSLRTRGINAAGNDLRRVTANGAGDTNKYIGKFVFKNTALGWVVAFLKSPYGLVTAAVNIAGFGAIVVLLMPTKERIHA